MPPSSGCSPPPRLAIDTEFMRERTYYPQLCLLQIATETDCFLIDPLAGLDLGPLYLLLARNGRLKILHAARQDLEVLLLQAARCRHRFSTPRSPPPCSVSAADRLRGTGRPTAGPLHRQGPDAHRLVAPPALGGTTRLCGRRRPPPADVARRLEAALAARGRARWVAEEAAAVEDPALYRTEPGEAWRRLKGLGRLGPGEQAAARALTEWREKRAIESRQAARLDPVRRGDLRDRDAGAELGRSSRRSGRCRRRSFASGAMNCWR